MHSHLHIYLLTKHIIENGEIDLLFIFAQTLAKVDRNYLKLTKNLIFFIGSQEQHSSDRNSTGSMTNRASFKSSSTGTTESPTATGTGTTMTSISMDSEYGGMTNSSFSESTDDPEATALSKRQFVIKELVDTERDYVNDLRQIVEGYMALMRDPNPDIPIPEDLCGGKEKMVFGNIEAIYEWHREWVLLKITIL